MGVVLVFAQKDEVRENDEFGYTARAARARIVTIFADSFLARIKCGVIRSPRVPCNVYLCHYSFSEYFFTLADKLLNSLFI